MAHKLKIAQFNTIQKVRKLTITRQRKNAYVLHRNTGFVRKIPFPGNLEHFRSFRED
jgi:hypothetical protein